MSLKISFTNCLLSGLFALCLFVANGPAFAQSGGLPDTACDPEYMDALEARAYLEAQREISQNQNLILKPDSVFEYTCFREALAHLANQDNFSESLLWGTVIGQGPTSLDLALNNAVWVPVLVYLTANFSHNYLHDRSALDYNTAGAVIGANYSCSQMAQVWDAAQCLDFFDEADDEFNDFDLYAGGWDPRRPILLGSCPAAAPSAADLSVAFNGQQDAYTVDNPWPSDTTPYVDDPVQTYLQLILPVGIDPANSCADAIPTGVTVDRINVAAYDDAVCPNPGCYYTGKLGSGSCVKSKP